MQVSYLGHARDRVGRRGDEFGDLVALPVFPLIWFSVSKVRAEYETWLG